MSKGSERSCKKDASWTFAVVSTFFIIFLENGILDKQTEDGHKSSFSLETGHDSILKLTEDKEEDIYICSLCC
jgi:hypothetical protein